MPRTVSDYVVDRLDAWGVRLVYGCPGHGIDGIMAALSRASERVRFVRTGHEESAAFMACAHAKWTGEVGVCVAPSGPGAIHLSSGLYDARLDHQPVVALVGQQARPVLGSDSPQEVDLAGLFKDVASAFVHTCVHPAQARHLVDRAMRIAMAERTVTCVILPSDLQVECAVEAPEREHGTAMTGVGFHRGRTVPTDDDLDAAAAILNRGERVAMLVGAGALEATFEVREAAEALGAGVAKALLGKAVLPDHLPFVTGAIGLVGTRASERLMQECDTLFVVGSSFPYVEWLPKEGQVEAVQIDHAPRMLGLRHPMDVSLHGDTRETLRALLPRLRRKSDRRFRVRVEGWVRDGWQQLERRARAKADPINPQWVFWELSSRLPDRVALTADSGSCAHWWARDLRVREGMKASLSGNLARMGPALPYALAAKMAEPDRPVIAVIGEGAMQLVGNSALLTIAAHAGEWEDPRLIVIVLNDGDPNMLSWEQRVMGSVPKAPGSQTLPVFPYARYAELLGLEGIEITTDEALGPGLDHALAANRPVVVDVHVDPDVPPLPPHMTTDQAARHLASMVRTDPSRWDALKQSLKAMWSGA